MRCKLQCNTGNAVAEPSSSAAAKVTVLTAWPSHEKIMKSPQISTVFNGMQQDVDQPSICALQSTHDCNGPGQMLDLLQVATSVIGTTRSQAYECADLL